jgi:hypothetical protein
MSEQKNSVPSVFTKAISNVTEEKNVNPLLVNNNIEHLEGKN